MAHHKRKRPKNRRAGCLMCKPWKANNAKANGMRSKEKASERRKTQSFKEFLDGLPRSSMRLSKADIADIVRLIVDR